MKKIPLTIILLLSPALVFAAPSTPTVTGDVIHGQSITLSGSSFGTKSTAAPLLWDDVTNSYTGITNGGLVPVGAEYVFNANAGDGTTHFKTTNQRGKATTHYTNTGTANAEGKAALGDRYWIGTTLLYVSWWLYSSANTCVSDNVSDKYGRFLNHATWDAGNPNFAYVIFEPHMVNIGGYIGAVGGAYYDTCVTGWHHYEFVIDSTPNPGPQVMYYLDSVAQNGGSPFTTPDNIAGDIDGIGNLGWDASNTPISGEPTIDWGEIYVDNTRARVEICNASTKAASSHCENQIPSAWSTTSITATVNQGSFADNSTAYLFVVDSTGMANSSGTAITFGSGAVVNGTCGSQSGSSAPSLTSSSPNLCSAGTVASFTGTGPWTWGCNGSGGGTSTASTACSATLAADTTAPTTTTTPAAGTYTSTQTVTLSCSDNVGCTSTQYCTGAACTPATSYTGPISVATTTTLRYRSSDSAGNTETIKESVYTINAGGGGSAATSTATMNCSFK